MALCGPISPQVWPGVEKLPMYHAAMSGYGTRCIGQRLSDFISAESRGAIGLIEWMLTLDPSRRPTAEMALAHEYFQADPQPGDLHAFFNSILSTPVVAY